MVKELDGDVLQIKSELYKICWYMRGGITADEAFSLSYEDRMVIGDIVKENLEITKKTGMAFF